MSGLSLLEPRMLWCLLLVPLYFGLRWWEAGRQLKSMAKFSDVELFKMLNPTLVVGSKSSIVRALLMMSAVLLIVLAAARPGGNPVFVEQEMTQRGVDIMLVVDLSSSMNATDLTPNRIQATKDALKQFIAGVHSDRVGMIVFAGTVSMQSPLTQDYRTAKMMVDIISTSFMPVDGTAIGDALLFALSKIGKENQKNAVIVLLTDGENTKGKPPQEALDKVKEAGTKIYTIGVGTAQGAKIPMKDEKGIMTFKQYMGQPVVTKLDEEFLKKAAKDTGGEYFSADTSRALMQAYDEISRLTKVEHKEKKKRSVYKEFYYWPALIALLFMLGDIFLGRRSEWLRFSRKPEA